MRKILLQTLKISGFLALGALLLYLSFRGIAFEELRNTLGRANFWWIGLSLVFLTLGFILRARRWVLLIQPLGYRPTFRNTYHALMVGYLSNYALPRLGEITRCVTLGDREKIPVDSLIGTVIIERVIDMFMLLLIMALLLVWKMEQFGAFFGDKVFGPMRDKMVSTFGGMFFFWLIIAVFLIVVVGLIWIYRKKLLEFSLVRKIASFLKGIADGLLTIGRMERKWEFIIQSILIWSIYIFMTWVVVFALEDTSHLGFIDGIFLLVVGGLGMAAPVTGGFGAYHWITSRGLVHVYGLTLEQGSAYAILAHEPNSLFTIFLGLISYLVIVISRRKSREHVSSS